MTVVPAALRVQPAFLEGAPLVITRPWAEGDERRGLRGVRCIVARCPHTLATGRHGFDLAANYLCLADAEAYGLAPPGAAAMQATETARRTGRPER